MTDLPTLHAWVDESIVTGTIEGYYVLAATVAEPGLCEPVREQVRRLLVGRSQRLHWRDEPQRRRRLIARTVASLDPTHTVVVGAPVDPRRQERARRLCMERLLYELGALRVRHVWLETRTESLNRRDLELVAALRSKGALVDTTVVDFALPTDEPMLWLPDAVAGAVTSHRRGDDAEPYAAIRVRLTEHDITLA